MKSKSFVPFVILSIFFFAGCTDKMSYYFKDKVPCYPHAKIVESMRLKGGCYAKLETDDSGKKVLEFYKDHMSKIGWSIRVERESASSNNNDSKSVAFLAFFKDNTGLTIDTSTSNDGGKTRIALFMGDTDE